MNIFAVSKPRGRPPSSSSSSSSSGGSGAGAGGEEGVPKLATLIANRDYTGAVTLLKFQQQTGEADNMTLPWLGYATFHLGDFQEALETYRKMLLDPKTDPVYHLYAACCLYYLGQHAEAAEEAKRGPANRLQNRLLMHCAHKLGDAEGLRRYEDRAVRGAAGGAGGEMGGAVEDALSVAALKYMRVQAQDATDDFQRLIKENMSLDALNISIAMCCYRLDHYVYALEFVNKYLQKHPDSALALNLKACCVFRIRDGPAASAELRVLEEKLRQCPYPFDNVMTKHNTVVFRSGDDAFEHLPKLVDVVPEARFNLAVHHLRQGEAEEAYKLVKDLQPVTPQDYIIKASATVVLAADDETSPYKKEAMDLLHSVGSSASERDTIPGRKCMAQYFFLERNWPDVLLYLSSIEEYCSNDDALHHNLGIAQAATGEWREALRHLLAIKNPVILDTYAYASWLVRCYIMDGQSEEAWRFYVESERDDGHELLHQLAYDAYRTGSFYIAFKAYETLGRLDPSQHNWEGKRGAACGVLQMVIAGRETTDNLREVIRMLKHHHPVTPQSESLTQVLVKWAEENRLSLD